MSSPENAAIPEDPAKNSIQPARFEAHNLLDRSQKNIGLMQDHDQLSSHLVNCSLEQAQETPRDQIVQSLANDLANTTKFVPSSEVAGWLKAGMKHQLRAGGATGADTLAGEITQKLPNGMELKITQDAKLENSVEQLAKEKGELKPDYVRFVELIKDGKSLGKFGMALRSSVQELAIDLGDAKQLVPGSPEVSSLIIESGKLYARGGARSADKLAEEINKTLPDGMKLKISNDPEYIKKVVEESKRTGKRIPDYIRLFELTDKDGKSLGKLGIGHFDEKKPRIDPRTLT